MNRSSDPLESLFATPPHGRLVLGLSGGLDSTVLLHALAAQPALRARGLRAVHVDHGLHADSGRWAGHCRQCCADLDVPLTVAQVTVVVQGDGLEAAARRARWQAFTDHTDPERDVLVLAHHRDDQAETLLLRLLRGAGPAGLAAMRVLSRRDNGLRVWRPLLHTSRQTLAAWAGRRRLAWIEDPGNDTLRFDRNQLRHRVLPVLRQRWPRLDATLAQVAQRQADAFALEQTVARQLLAEAATADQDRLDLRPLRAADRPVRWAALRHWLAGHGVVDVGADRLQRIDTELIAAAIDATPRICLAGRVLRRYRDLLHVLPPDGDRPLHYRLDWNGQTALTLPDGIGTLSIEPAPARPLALTVTTRQGGERLRLHANGPRRPLRLLWQETGVPPWLRSRWPVLWLDGEPAAFADRLIGAQLKERLGDAVLRLHRQPMPNTAASDD